MEQSRDTLVGMFGPGTAPSVSFAATVAWGPDDLLVGELDSLFVIKEKMDRCRQIVEQGGSLAVALGTLPRDGGPINYTQAAKAEMTPMERTQYEAWERGIQLPPLRTDEDRRPHQGGPSAKTRDERRLAWLRRAYKNENLALENLQFFHTVHNYLVPLLCAGAKIIGQERNATQNAARDARFLAEQVAASKLAGAASARQNAIQAEIAKLNKEIAAGVQTLQARKEAMKPPVEEGRKKHVPINEGRTAVGLPALGKVNIWHVEGAQGRGARLFTERPAETGSGRTRDDEEDQEPMSERRASKRARTVRGRGAPRARGGTARRGRSAAAEQRNATPGPSRNSPAYRPRSPGGDNHSEGESMHVVL